MEHCRRQLFTESLDSKLHKLAIENAKFQRACKELILLDNRERDLAIRYMRATKSANLNFRYSMRMKMAAVSGIKLMFYRYAEQQAQRVNRLSGEIAAKYGFDALAVTQ